MSLIVALPACTTEDASAPGQQFPCLWDASTQGNGQGHSFVVDFVDDVPHYVTDVLTDGTVLTSDALPGAALTATPAELAHTGVDPFGWVAAALMVAVGLTLVRVGARRSS